MTGDFAGWSGWGALASPDFIDDNLNLTNTIELDSGTYEFSINIYVLIPQMKIGIMMFMEILQQFKL